MADGKGQWAKSTQALDRASRERQWAQRLAGSSAGRMHKQRARAAVQAAKAHRTLATKRGFKLPENIMIFHVIPYLSEAVDPVQRGRRLKGLHKSYMGSVRRAIRSQAYWKRDPASKAAVARNRKFFDVMSKHGYGSPYRKGAAPGTADYQNSGPSTHWRQRLNKAVGAVKKRGPGPIKNKRIVTAKWGVRSGVNYSKLKRAAAADRGFKLP